MLQSVLFRRPVDGFCSREWRQKCVFVLSVKYRRKPTPPSFSSSWHILSLWDDAEVHHHRISWLVRTGTASSFVLTAGLWPKWNLKAAILMAASKYYRESKLQIESWQEKSLTYSISKSCVCANSSDTVPEKMCCSNITHCLSVQKYWSKFSLWCKQRQFHEHFWCCTYLFTPMWPTTIRVNSIKWLRGIYLNRCKQRKLSSRANSITSAHIAGAWVLWDKNCQSELRKREKGQSNTHRNGVLFQPRTPPSARLWGKLLVPFRWCSLSQQDPEGRSYATSQSMLPSMPAPLAPLLPKQLLSPFLPAAWQATGSSLVAARGFITPRLDFAFSVVYFQPYFVP